MRLFGVLSKGVIVVPDPIGWTRPWLDATRRPSLQRVANRPIVCHVLDTLRDAGILEVAIVSPDEEARAEIAACVSAEGPPGLDVSYLTVGADGRADSALAIAAEFAGDDPCVLHRANGLLGAPLAPFVQLAGDEAADALLLVREDSRATRRLRLVPQRRLRAIEGDDTQAALAAVAGVLLFAEGALGRLAALEPDLGASERDLDLYALAQRLANEGGRVHLEVAPKWHHFDGDALDLLDMNRTMLDRLHPEQTVLATDGNRFEGPIVIHPSAHISSSVIIGPVIIGADALIADSYIGPHTSIGERVRIEGAELERSIVLADASVLHVGGRLVASIVGRQARIFRDFSMPRALRLQVGDGDEVALC